MRPSQKLAAVAFAALALLAFASAADARNLRSLAPTARPADAVEVWRCGFENDDWDKNYDEWPDRWVRDDSPQYPSYVEVELDDDPSTTSGRCLNIHLDGAQARISSPPIFVTPKFGYFVELKVRQRSVERSKVWVVFEYLNSAGESRLTFRQGVDAGDGDWTTVRFEPQLPRSNDVDRAVIRIETERGARGDLAGVVSIADLWLARLPRIELTANNDFHVYTDPRDVLIRCNLSGIRERNPDIVFQLLDARGIPLGDAGVQSIHGRAIDERKLIRQKSLRASEIIDGLTAEAATRGYEGSAAWRPEIEQYGGHGFFQVRAVMLSSKTGEEILTRMLTLAVLPELSSAKGGEFGWTLPDADYPLSFATLEKLLPMTGVNWVKLPVWFPPGDFQRGEAIIQFADRLAASEIETVGILRQPPIDAVSEPELLGDAVDEDREIANLLGRDPARWQSLFDHVMTRLSLRIRWWQLGEDGDTSFVGYEDLIAQVKRIRQTLFRFGQDVNLGLGWRWDTDDPTESAPWDFAQMASSTPATVAELDTLLAGLAPTAPAPEDAGATNQESAAPQRWVLIHPQYAGPEGASSQEMHEARLRQFIQQIVVAKRRGVDRLFISHPFSGPHGLMTADGKPGELLLPWRTAASLLGGADYLGSLQLPSASENRLFRRPDGLVVMVVWNRTPTTEKLYLGDDVKQVDVWGRTSPLPTDEGRQVLSVTSTPTFVVNLNESIARWRMAVRFARQNVPSVFAEDHPNELVVHNTFAHGVAARFSLFVPDLMSHKRGDANRGADDHWRINLPSEDFQSRSKGVNRLPMSIRLRDAAVGVQPVRIDFVVDADRAEDAYRFSVWRSLTVGVGDIIIQTSTELDEAGRLVVRQETTNTGGGYRSFKCYLQAPGERRKRAQVIDLGPERDVKLYTYPFGKKLVHPELPDGKRLPPAELKLRLEEIDGPRILIHRFSAEPEAAPATDAPQDAASAEEGEPTV